MDRQGLTGITLERTAYLDLDGLPSVIAPMLVKRANGSEFVLGLRNPLTPDEPADDSLREFRDLSTTVPVYLVDELVVRKNLPAATPPARAVIVPPRGHGIPRLGRQNMQGEIKPPDTWPEPPRQMSVSSLRAIESCPRRWALSTASYPDLWRGIGYPPRIQRSWLMGSVVHLAIERIVRRLAQANCGSLSDPCAPSQ